MPEQEHKRSVRTTVSVPVDDYTKLERLATLKKVSVAWVIRDAIETYLKSDCQVVNESTSKSKASTNR
jgi:predicted transcriptional regulator